jgi:hypothetical protein
MLNKFCLSFLVGVILFGFGCQASVFEIERNITVESVSNSNPLHITGQARVFEGTFLWRLKNEAGEVINFGSSQTQAPDIGQFGPFDFYAVVPEVSSSNLILEVFQASPKDGSDQDLISVPVVLERSDSREVQLYFHNNILDPEISCDKVFPVTRKIVATESVARAAIVALLQGPNDGEQLASYSTAIPFRTELKDIALSKDGTLTVDLKGAIAGPLGGSCLVTSIASEIRETVKQFENVKSVRILIDGEENQLEP